MPGRAGFCVCLLRARAPSPDQEGSVQPERGAAVGGSEQRVWTASWRQRVSWSTGSGEPSQVFEWAREEDSPLAVPAQDGWRRDSEVSSEAVKSPNEKSEAVKRTD